MEKFSDILFFALFSLLLPTGILAILHLNFLAEKMYTSSEKFNPVNVTPTSIRWNKFVFSLMSLTAILIGIAACIKLFIIITR
ncbi:hypothetical protein [Alkaliphilus sp. B6464]|uniref:hypothetical protein n=1 Tax=Alkaliphilus sp. B6464 TaxID=2731219 RepID=UPI001BABCC8A|nr:hypothetical protein [Alkaliphilus sp. B6464]QUH19428.1 hypothetical protein HYG84_05705 [Alkaliphilus sp. B6464]